MWFPTFCPHTPLLYLSICWCPSGPGPCQADDGSPPVPPSRMCLPSALLPTPRLTVPFSLPPFHTAMGPVVPGSEVVIGFQALDCVLSAVAGLEALTEAALNPPPPPPPQQQQQLQLVVPLPAAGVGGKGAVATPPMTPSSGGRSEPNRYQLISHDPPMPMRRSAPACREARLGPLELEPGLDRRDRRRGGSFPPLVGALCQLGRLDLVQPQQQCRQQPHGPRRDDGPEGRPGQYAGLAVEAGRWAKW